MSRIGFRITTAARNGRQPPLSPQFVEPVGRELNSNIFQHVGKSIAGSDTSVDVEFDDLCQRQRGTVS